ncbi:MAG: DUF4230 domain-containing protein [Lachnospiraceae bacterium]|nr:DUF4230 domain-containing protein [Lachnospiraceae bacterium]
MNQAAKTNDVKKFFQDRMSNIKEKKNTRKKKNTCKTTSICFCIIVINVIIYCLCGLFKSGGTALVTTYQAVYKTEREAAYQEKYEDYKAAAEEKYHVSNKVSIYVGNLQEEQKLEVLKVNDVEFIIENREDNSSNIVSWLEVPGEGTFVVDLRAGEYIVDEERANVLVRVPYPELINVHIDYADVQKILFKNDMLNESYKIGEDLAKRQLDKADALLKKEFTSNQNFYLNAQEAAKHTIEALVKQLNPEVSNLSVDVEFYDMLEQTGSK